MNPPLVSVIVPVYNARALLLPCLSAIRLQEGIGPGEMEVIVVDDGSSDYSPLAAAGLCDRLIRLEHNSGAAAARNRGAREARGSILVFVDVDVFLEPRALMSLRRAFETRPEIAAAVGRYTARPAAKSLVSVYHNAFTRYHHDLAPREIDWFWGALGAARRDAFFAAGGFDERYRGASAEDMELGAALSRKGYRIVYCPEAEGAHAHPFTLARMFENDYKKAALGVKLKLRGRLPRGAPGFANPRNVLAALLAPVWLVSLFLALFHPGALAATILAAAGLALLNLPFYRRLASSLSGAKIVGGVLLHWLQLIAILAGAGAGLMGHLLGRSPYGRPGWI